MSALGRTGIAELYIVRDYLGDVALGTVLRIIGTGLKAALDGNFAALAQIAGAELRGLTPADDGEEIRLTNALLIGKAALNGDAQRALRDAGLRGAGFRICGEVSNRE